MILLPACPRIFPYPNQYTVYMHTSQNQIVDKCQQVFVIPDYKL